MSTLQRVCQTEGLSLLAMSTTVVLSNLATEVVSLLAMSTWGASNRLGAVPTDNVNMTGVHHTPTEAVPTGNVNMTGVHHTPTEAVSLLTMST